MTKEDILKIVIKNTCEVMPELEGHQFSRNDRLVDLGANSIDRADIVALTVEELSLIIPRIELAVAKNIGGLVDVLYEKIQSS